MLESKIQFFRCVRCLKYVSPRELFLRIAYTYIFKKLQCPQRYLKEAFYQ